MSVTTRFGGLRPGGSSSAGPSASSLTGSASSTAASVSAASSSSASSSSGSIHRPLTAKSLSLRPHGNKRNSLRKLKKGKKGKRKNNALSSLWPGRRPQNSVEKLDQGPKLKDQSGPRKIYSLAELLNVRLQYRELPKDLPHFNGVTGLGLGLQDDAPDTWEMPETKGEKSSGLIVRKPATPVENEPSRNDKNEKSEKNKRKRPKHKLRPKQEKKPAPVDDGKEKSTPAPQPSSEDVASPQVETPTQPEVIEIPQPQQKKAVWRRPSELDPMDRLEKKIKGILNKLTVDKFDGLSEQFCDYCKDHVTNKEQLEKVVSLIFDKAVDEPEFVKMYADLCVNVNNHAPNFENDHKEKQSKPTTFLRSLLTQCQTRFQENVSFTTARREPGMSEEDYEYLQIKLKKHMIGNVNFIGQLFNVKLLKEKVMHTCIRHLIGSGNPSAEDCERLCALLTTIGKTLDQTTHEQYKQAMDDTFRLLKGLAFKKDQDSRVKFMLLDVVDLRANEWKPRQEKLQPKKIEEIHREAKEEELRQDYLNGSTRPKPHLEKNSINKYGITNDGTQAMSRRELVSTVAEAIGGGSFTMDQTSSDVAIKRSFVRYDRRTQGKRTPKSSDKTDSQPTTETPDQQPGASPSDSAQRFNSFGLLPSRKTTVRRKQPVAQPSTTTETPTAVLNTEEPSVGGEEQRETYTTEEENEMKKELITKFLDAADKEAIKSAKKAFGTLRFDKYMYVAELIRTSCDRNEIEREATTTILNELFDAREISSKHITAGLNDLMEMVCVELMDAPKLLIYLSGIFARFLLHGSISLEFVSECVKLDPDFKANNENEKFVVLILEAAIVEANADKVTQLINGAGSSLSDLITTSSIREAFLQKHKLDIA